jgi:hypothetical protein
MRDWQRDPTLPRYGSDFIDNSIRGPPAVVFRSTNYLVCEGCRPTDKCVLRMLVTNWPHKRYGRQCWQPYLVDINGRGERIRTSDLSVPNRALYQAEPRPDVSQTGSTSDRQINLSPKCTWIIGKQVEGVKPFNRDSQMPSHIAASMESEP